MQLWAVFPTRPREEEKSYMSYVSFLMGIFLKSYIWAKQTIHTQSQQITDVEYVSPKADRGCQKSPATQRTCHLQNTRYDLQL